MSEQIRQLNDANQQAGEKLKETHARLQAIQRELDEAAAERDLQYAAIIAKTPPPAGEGSDG